MPNKSGLENVLKSILSVANAEQNFAYAPNVFETHYNIVTSFLLDNLAIVYPQFVDAVLPFIKSQNIPVINGYVDLPADYRNLLGAPSITVRPDGGDCSSQAVIIDTDAEFKAAQLKSGCKTYSIEMVDKGQWDARTTSEYAFPTHKNPIGLWDGGRRFKVCPYDLAYVKVTYLKKEQIYRYGYITQPDDTFIFDPVTSIDGEWDEAAFELLFKGIFALYSTYSRDQTIMEYSQLLNKAGLF